jgi:hypothetical protein
MHTTKREKQEVRYFISIHFKKVDDKIEVEKKTPRLDFQFGNPFQFQKFPPNPQFPHLNMLSVDKIPLSNQDKMNSPVIGQNPFLMKQLIPKIAPKPNFQHFQPSNQFQLSSPSIQPPVTTTNESKIREQCNSLLKGCNKVTNEIENQIFKFLLGTGSDLTTSGDEKEENKIVRLLLHEEPNQHQIIFQMDFENHSWKKVMKKIKP